jgi:predicted ATPase
MVMKQVSTKQTSDEAERSSLEILAEQEARRAKLQQNFEPDPALVAQGWQRRFTGDARRVQEAAELYTGLGFEVLTVPVQAWELKEECEGCRLVALLQFKTIYTRSTGS